MPRCHALKAAGIICNAKVRQMWIFSDAKNGDYILFLDCVVYIPLYNREQRIGKEERKLTLVKTGCLP